MVRLPSATQQPSIIGVSINPAMIYFSGFDEGNHLTIHSDMTTVVKAMANPESGLEVRDRMWLKITIANAFIGKLSFTTS